MIRSNTIYLHPDENGKFVTADFTAPLTSGVENTIASVTSVADIGGSLTIANTSVNTSAVEESNGNIIQPSKSITFEVDAGLTASTSYDLKATLVLTNNSEPMIGIIPIEVSSDTGVFS